MVAAIGEFYDSMGCAAGRGTYRGGDESAAKIQAVRRRIATLIGAQTEEVVFTFNGTDSLNMAILGAVRGQERVVTTELEHNSVLRPLHHLQKNRQIQLSTVRCDSLGRVDLADWEAEISQGADFAVVSHASNVTGTIQPIAEIAKMCRHNGCRLLVDAAQTVGHVDTDVAKIGCDFLAAAGHKGLLGPLGTGILYVKEAAQRDLESFRFGGTGSNSDQPVQPDSGSSKYESGNMNVAGINGLGCGVEFIQATGIEAIRQSIAKLTRRLVEGFSEIADIRVYGHDEGVPSVGVVSVTLGEWDSRELASLLDAQWEIQTRAGFHCAPLIHKSLGSRQNGGTLRFSPGYFNTMDEMEQVIEAMRTIAAA